MSGLREIACKQPKNHDQMTEQAPQLLFDDGSRAIQQTSASDVETAASLESARGSGGSSPISKFYEIDRIAAGIVEVVRQKKCTEQLEESSDHWFPPVDLQYPDAILCNSPEVFWEMDALETSRGSQGRCGWGYGLC
ncbi:expressed unknown protein [Seminavis robusta]|uniref:Uncharacterized protein n=1 Tax=Seminavis robusta TaxID=568900 RepID=A0A9N8HK58_9STRA|nr:expressed unknown protein [Seminavis robusta]|eukprot:Sro915_g219700.1 n/a (137) ;mRNA; r:13836-14246